MMFDALQSASMRTTLDIDNDVLLAAKELARHQHKTAGQVVSELLRKALTSDEQRDQMKEEPAVYGFEPFPSRGSVVTNQVINDLKDDLGI